MAWPPYPAIGLLAGLISVVRFCFAGQDATLLVALERLRRSENLAPIVLMGKPAISPVKSGDEARFVIITTPVGTCTLLVSATYCRALLLLGNERPQVLTKVQPVCPQIAQPALVSR